VSPARSVTRLPGFQPSNQRAEEAGSSPTGAGSVAADVQQHVSKRVVAFACSPQHPRGIAVNRHGTRLLHDAIHGTREASSDILIGDLLGCGEEPANRENSRCQARIIE
jgi:hypothetical protein